MADIYTISSTTTNTLNPIRDKALYTLVEGAGSSTIVNKLTSALTSSMSSQTASAMNLIPVINDGKMQGMDISTFKDILYPVESDWVEIGGIKWAKMNVGATGVTDTGLYFQWGDTQGYTASQVGSDSGQKYFGWSDYKYSNNGGSGCADMTKYNSTDGKTRLETSDDAAYAASNGECRMPTWEQFDNLINATNSAWTSNYEGSGVAGFILTDKTDSSKVLFFPAMGMCENGSVTEVNTRSRYWIRDLYSRYCYCGHGILASDVYFSISYGYGLRRDGRPIRGIFI